MTAVRAIVAALLVPALVVPGPRGTTLRAREPILVLYDSGGPRGEAGATYALMLRNLLGHFDVTPVAEPVSTYRPGQLHGYRTTFYIGSTFDEPYFYNTDTPQRAAYRAFLTDAATTTRTLVWMGYNLNHVAWAWDRAWGASFRARYGLTYGGVAQDAGYNRVVYRGVELDKGVVRPQDATAVPPDCSAEPDGRLDCATQLSVLTVADPARAEVVAEATSTSTGARAPYIVRAGRFWHVGDIPFGFTSEQDRYLAFADVLHDMVGQRHAPRRRALVRLEDVSTWNDPKRLRATLSLLRNRGVPYGVAAIPFYRASNDGPEYGLAGSAVGAILREEERAGRASIVQHGTTHQSETGPNPFNGTSGDDFEFLRVTADVDRVPRFEGPLPGDSAAWMRERLERGRRQLVDSGLDPFAWEAPHYAASATDYIASTALYDAHWGRVAYYPSPGSRPVFQFFPYVVRDVYGQTVVPEDLGGISTDRWSGFAVSQPEDLVRRASKMLVVRDSFASFMFHPYLDPSLLGQAIDGIERLGYRFERPCRVVDACAPGARAGARD